MLNRRHVLVLTCGAAPATAGVAVVRVSNRGTARAANCVAVGSHLEAFYLDLGILGATLSLFDKSGYLQGDLQAVCVTRCNSPGGVVEAVWALAALVIFGADARDAGAGDGGHRSSLPKSARACRAADSQASLSP